MASAHCISGSPCSLLPKLLPSPHNHPQWCNSTLRRTFSNNWSAKHSSMSFSKRVVCAAGGGAGAETLVVENPALPRLLVFKGCPTPLGATAKDDGVNFAVYSGNAVSATLCLISASDLEKVLGFFLLFLSLMLTDLSLRGLDCA